MDPSTLRFELFGRLAIHAGPEVYRCPPLTAALLTRLLIAPGALVTVDELVRDVWPSATRRAVGRDERIAVQKRISALRRLLDPDHPGEDSPVLQTERGAVTAYRLLISSAQVDVLRYHALAEQALQTDDPALGGSLALEAAALWRDRPLLDVHEHPFAAPVVQRLTMLRKQLDQAFGQDLSQSLGIILDRDPAQSRGRDQVPDPSGGQARAAAPDQVGLSPPAPAVWSVPPRWSGRLPRTALLTALRRQLAAGRVVLCGPGGIGKSALATEYAHQFARGLEVVWWVDAEDPGRIGAQYAALADELRLAGPGTPTAELTSLVRRHLRSAPPGRWLLIFDNAEDPAALLPWLSDGPGQVLITSRNPGWDEVARPLPVPLFTRAESRQLLDRRLPGAPDAVVDEICDRLGDLPLALAQAAGVLAVTGMSAQALLAELTVDPAGVARSDPPVTYPRSLAAAVGLSMQRLLAEPEATQAARLCAVLAADPLPMSILAPAGDRAARAAVGRLRRLGLIGVADAAVRMHRLIQAIIADRCDSTEQTRLRREAAVRIAAHLHGDRGADPRSWPIWQALLPHLLAADPDSSDDPDVLTTAVWAVRFVNIRGGHAEAVQLGERLRSAWAARLGSEHRFTLAVQTEMAMAVYLGGDPNRARDLLERAHTALRRCFGVEDLQTQVSATDLCIVLDALGHTRRARDLAVENLAAQDRTVGANDIDRLVNASALSDYMYNLGDHSGGMDLLTDTYQRMLRVLGEEHPWTIQAASFLALYRAENGEHESAMQQATDALQRQRALLGDNHVDTLNAMIQLAQIHAIAHRNGEARTLLKVALTRGRDLFGPDHVIPVYAQRYLDDIERAASSASADADQRGAATPR